MTLDELRLLSRRVEWAAEHLTLAARDDGGAFEENVRRFRELVDLARGALVRQREVEDRLATGIRALAAMLSEEE